MEGWMEVEGWWRLLEGWMAGGGWWRDDGGWMDGGGMMEGWMDGGRADGGRDGLEGWVRDDGGRDGGGMMEGSSPFFLNRSGKCSSLIYDVKFENSSMLIEEPFYLKEVYLPTDCSDCLLVYEDVASGGDTFSSLLLFSRRRNVSDAAMDDLKGKAECLGMPSPIMVDAKSDLCPEDVPPSEGLSALNSIFEAKMGHHVARLLDALFDALVN
ncbi:hypothetical protein D4764_06G0013800 [Takifugu flavidus]|uniref:Uncharacterized protein n=1 Tax=Takifugu flavidus TaxID=433684 RepID=A0A5C6N2H0_9TELE|nr:hypothetical protein D4764_06G0013800 [Takifugu flavidus]